MENARGTTSPKDQEFSPGGPTRANSESRQMETAHRTGPMSLGAVVAAVLRKWFAAFLVFFVVVAAAVALGVTWPVAYTSTAVVAVSPLVTDATGDRTVDLNIATERVIVMSREVATIAAKTLGAGVDPGDLQGQVSVTVPADSGALEIAVSAETPDAAADAANAFAEGYLSYRTNEGTVAAQRASESIDERITALLDGQDFEASSSAVQQQVTDLRSSQTAIRGNWNSAGEIVTNAVAPKEPSSAGLTIFLASGIAAGALLAFGAALLLDRLDPRVRSANLLSRHVPLRVVSGGGAGNLEQMLREMSLVVDATRRETGLSSSTAPVVLLGPDAGAGDQVLLALRRMQPTEASQRFVVIPEAGSAGVALAVATQPRDALYIVLCRPKDRLDDVIGLVRELATWDRQPILVVVSGGKRDGASRKRSGRDSRRESPQLSTEPG